MPECTSPRLRRATTLAAIWFCASVSGCAEFPEIRELEGPPGPPPVLQPLDAVLPDPSSRDDPAPALAARAKGLQARAAAIGAP